jgi:hypothetical protein
MRELFLMLCLVLSGLAHAESVHCTELLGDLHCDDGTRIRNSPLGGVDVDNQSLTKPYKPPNYAPSALDFPSVPAGPMSKQDSKVLLGILGATSIAMGAILPTSRTESNYKCDSQYKNCKWEDKEVKDSGAESAQMLMYGLGVLCLGFSFAF